MVYVDVHLHWDDVDLFAGLLTNTGHHIATAAADLVCVREVMVDVDPGQIGRQGFAPRPAPGVCGDLDVIKQIVGDVIADTVYVGFVEQTGLMIPGFRTCAKAARAIPAGVLPPSWRSGPRAARSCVRKSA